MYELYYGIQYGARNLVLDIAAFDWELLFIWCLLLAIDIATGYLRACKEDTVESGIMRGGIYKKMIDTFSIFAILLMQGVANYLGIAAPIGPILIGAFCFKELTSILENAADGCGSLPKAVKHWIEKIKGNF